MALKNVCLVPRGWTLEDYQRHSCEDGSHRHLSAAQLVRYELQGRARVLARAGAKHERTVAALVTAYRVATTPTVRDASCYIGAYLVIALAEKQEWAVVMVADTRRRAVREDLSPDEFRYWRPGEEVLAAQAA